MPGAEDNPANRRQGEPRESADRILEEMLREIGADILDEPVPEKLRRVLRPTGGSDRENTASDGRHHPQSSDEGGRPRDDEPSRRR